MSFLASLVYYVGAPKISAMFWQWSHLSRDLEITANARDDNNKQRGVKEDELWKISWHHLLTENVFVDIRFLLVRVCNVLLLHFNQSTGELIDRCNIDILSFISSFNFLFFFPVLDDFLSWSSNHRYQIQKCPHLIVFLLLHHQLHLRLPVISGIYFLIAYTD